MHFGTHKTCIRLAGGQLDVCVQSNVVRNYTGEETGAQLQSELVIIWQRFGGIKFKRHKCCYTWIALKPNILIIIGGCPCIPLRNVMQIFVG